MSEKNEFAKMIDRFITKKNEIGKMTGASGELPEPDSFDYTGGIMKWTWVIDLSAMEKAEVILIMDVKEGELISCRVTIDLPSDDFSDLDDAKKFAEALLAAWRWRDIWKEAGASFLVKWMESQNKRLINDEPPF